MEEVFYWSCVFVVGVCMRVDGEEFEDNKDRDEDFKSFNVLGLVDFGE